MDTDTHLTDMDTVDMDMDMVDMVIRIMAIAAGTIVHTTMGIIPDIMGTMIITDMVTMEAITGHIIITGPDTILVVVQPIIAGTITVVCHLGHLMDMVTTGFPVAQQAERQMRWEMIHATGAEVI